MKVDREQLSAYVLGLLDEAERQELERLIAQSKAHQQELRALQKSFFGLAELAPLQEAPADSWQKLHKRIQEDKRQQNALNQQELQATNTRAKAPVFWQHVFKQRQVILPFILTACLVVTSLLAYQWRQEIIEDRQELKVITRWMANPDLRIIELEQVNTEQAGLLCSYPDGRMLFITESKAPRNKQFVVWERKGETLTQVSSTSYRMARFNHESADGYVISLEKTKFKGEKPSTIYYQTTGPILITSVLEPQSVLYTNNFN